MGMSELPPLAACDRYWPPKASQTSRAVLNPASWGVLPASACAGACRRSPSCTTRCWRRARRRSSWKRGWMCWTRCGCAARAVHAVRCCSCLHSTPAGQHCAVSCMTAPPCGAGCSSHLPSSILVRPLMQPSLLTLIPPLPRPPSFFRFPASPETTTPTPPSCPSAKPAATCPPRCACSGRCRRRG